MSNQHPITPPPELVQEWWLQAQSEGGPGFQRAVHYVATQAAQWGADMELEACCMWITREKSVLVAEELGIARRPKPPSLKEQALKAADLLFDHAEIGECALAQATIRRALEALPND